MLGFRAALEHRFEAELRSLGPNSPLPVVAELERLADAPGPSLSRYMVDDGTLRQFVEFVVHRSAYQLKEADPHTWVIPRLSGGPKAAVIHVQMVPGGEAVQNDVHVVERMLKCINAADLDRRSYIVVIGGGAVLDAVGFAAAIAHRGIRLVRIPTTTLAQADSGAFQPTEGTGGRHWAPEPDAAGTPGRAPTATLPRQGGEG